MNNFIKYSNIKVHYSDVGSGKPVILLHGFLEDISMWSRLQKTLDKKYRVICIDLFGHGKTQLLDEVFTLEEMAQMIKVVLDTLKINSVTLVGHSLGGYVALAFANAFSKTVSGLVLMNSTAKADSEERKANRLRAIEMADKNYEALISMSVSNLFSQASRPKFLSQIQKTKEIALRISKQTYIATTKAMLARKDRTKVLESGEFRKLIIAGKKDPVLSYPKIEEEANQTQTALKTFSNGHMSHIENESELIKAIEDFLE